MFPSLVVLYVPTDRDAVSYRRRCSSKSFNPSLYRDRRSHNIGEVVGKRGRATIIDLYLEGVRIKYGSIGSWSMTGCHGYHRDDRLAVFITDRSSMAIECTCGVPFERSFAFVDFEPRFKITNETEYI